LFRVCCALDDIYEVGGAYVWQTKHPLKRISLRKDTLKKRVSQGTVGSEHQLSSGLLLPVFMLMD